MDISNISVSRKGVWNECQQRYKYKYHLKVESLEEEPFYFIYGKIIHKIAEVYVASAGEKTLGQVTQEVIDRKIPVDKGKDGEIVYAPEIPKDYKARMGGHLESIQKITATIGFGGMLEYEFKHDLDPPNDKKVHGFIDRLIQKGDNWFILDYKTSKKNMFRKNRGNIIHDLQLRTYARIVQKNFDVPAKNIKAALYYLEGGNLVGASFSDKSLSTVEEELLHTFNEIRNTPEDGAWGNVGDHCRRCDYRKICPFYRIT